MKAALKVGYGVSTDKFFITYLKLGLNAISRNFSPVLNRVELTMRKTNFIITIFY